MKKVLFAVCCILAFVFSFSKVNAKEVSETFSTGPWIDGIFLKKEYPDGHIRYQKGKFIKRDSDGEVVYCLEPFASLDEDAEYNVTYSDYQKVINLTDEQLEKINLLAYYGYGYENHTDEKWFTITQVLIWKEVDPDAVIYFTETLNGKRNDNLFTKEKEELLNMVSNHYNQPDLLMPSNMFIGDSKTIEDSKKLLKDYSIIDSKNITGTIENNFLKIEANSVGNAYIKLEKDDKRYKETPALYYVDNSQKVFRVGNYKPLSITLNTKVEGGKIKLNKIDSETNNIPQGEALLDGAKYNIMNQKGDIISTLTINKNSAVSDYLPLGTYKIKESVNPKGYLIDNNTYTIEITESKTYELVLKEKVINNYISILKQYNYVNGNSTFLNAEEGVVFEIYNNQNKIYKQITTDKNGYAGVNLPYGTWKFHQVNSVNGYEKIYDFFVVVDEKSELNQTYNILNNKISAYLQVYKMDKETNQVIKLSDTTFKILDKETNNYVSQYVGGKVYSEFKTDENGMFITPLKLESGDYKLIETSSPKGYLIGDGGYDFSIKDNTIYYSSSYGSFVSICVYDEAIKGYVEVIKTKEVYDSVNDIYMIEDANDVKFNIFAGEDILSSDGMMKYFEKDELVDILITDSTGYAISKQLPLGKYYMLEINEDDKYILNDTVYDINLEQVDNKTKFVYQTFNIFNELKKEEPIVEENPNVEKELIVEEEVIVEKEPEEIMEEIIEIKEEIKENYETPKTISMEVVDNINSVEPKDLVIPQNDKLELKATYIDDIKNPSTSDNILTMIIGLIVNSFFLFRLRKKCK